MGDLGSGLFEKVSSDAGMNALLNLLDLQSLMLLCLLCGFIMRRYRVLPDESRSVLTRLIIYFVIPCSIISSFQKMELTDEIMKNMQRSFIIACIVQVLGIVLAVLMWNRKPERFRPVLKGGTVVSNAGTLGTPMIYSVLGAEAMIYSGIFQIVMRIVMWTAGVWFFTKSTDFKGSIRRAAVHPCVLSTVVGIVLMFTGIKLPAVFLDGMEQIGSASTMLCMVLIGTILAESDLKKLFSIVLLEYGFVRLLLIPGLVFAGCRLFSVNTLLTGVAVILICMPMPVLLPAMAAQNDGDYVFASQCVVFSTLFALVTTPLWCALI